MSEYTLSMWEYTLIANAIVLTFVSLVIILLSFRLKRFGKKAQYIFIFASLCIFICVCYFNLPKKTDLIRPIVNYVLRTSVYSVRNHIKNDKGLHAFCGVGDVSYELHKTDKLPVYFDVVVCRVDRDVKGQRKVAEILFTVDTRDNFVELKDVLINGKIMSISEIVEWQMFRE